MQQSNNLNTDYQGFISTLVTLLRRCRDTPQQVFCIVIVDAPHAQLIIIENFSYKYVELVKLPMGTNSDERIR